MAPARAGGRDLQPLPGRPADLAAGSGIGRTCNGEISPPGTIAFTAAETSSRTCPLDDMEDRLAQNRR